MTEPASGSGEAKASEDPGRALLDVAAVQDWLVGRLWVQEGGALVCERVFRDFVAALAFVNRVGELAEVAGHHPDIDIRWNRVRLALVTHSAGGLTQADLDLAGQIDSLA